QGIGIVDQADLVHERGITALEQFERQQPVSRPFALGHGRLLGCLNSDGPPREYGRASAPSRARNLNGVEGRPRDGLSWEPPFCLAISTCVAARSRPLESLRWKPCRPSSRRRPNEGSGWRRSPSPGSASTTC